MVNHQSAKLGGHKDCGSGGLIFLVVKEQDSTYLPKTPSFLFISETHGIKAHIMIW